MRNRPIKFKKAIRVSMTLGLLSLSAIIVGCGSTAYREGVDNTGGASTGPGTAPVTPTTGAGTGTSGGTTTTTNTQVATANFSYTFQLTGGQATTMTSSATNPVPMRVSTDTLLRVKVRAGNPVTFQTAGWAVGFNCQRFTVTVEGQSLEAFVLRQGYTPTVASDPCFSAESVATLDFSGRLSPGHGAITLEASGAQYDNCHYYNEPRAGGCPVHQVYSTHRIEGKFEIEVNSTR